MQTYPYSYAVVWKSLLDTTADYRYHTKDAERGILLTWWRSIIIREVAELWNPDDYQHGVKIDARGVGEKTGMSEFNVQNRLVVTVVSENDSTTTISLTNIFRAAPDDLTAKSHSSTPFSGKVFSSAIFDTREEHRLLEKIGAACAKKTAEERSHKKI